MKTKLAHAQVLLLSSSEQPTLIVCRQQMRRKEALMCWTGPAPVGAKVEGMIRTVSGCLKLSSQKD